MYFGAMNEIDRKILFEHKFTDEMNFRNHFDKIKCFRVMNEEGKIVNKGGYENLISDEKLIKMFETMVTINEADIIYNSA
jgi:hypothetical protein